MLVKPLPNTLSALGIAAKLYLAFAAIFLLAVLSYYVGLRGYTRIAQTQTTIIDEAIPHLRQTHELVSINGLVGDRAQRLFKAANEAERFALAKALFGYVADLNSTVNTLGRNNADRQLVEALQQQIQVLANGLHRQNDLIRQRNRQSMLLQQLSLELAQLADKLIDLADSLVANAAASTSAITSNLYDLVEDEVPKDALFNVFDRLMEVDIDAMERMYELRLRGSILQTQLIGLAKQSDYQQTLDHQAKTRQTLNILKRRVVEINDPLRRALAGNLIKAVVSPQSRLNVDKLYAARLRLSEIESMLDLQLVDVQQASRALNEAVSRFNTVGGERINQASSSAREALRRSRSIFIVASVLAVILASALIWLYVRNRVLRRLERLEHATHSIAAGDYAVVIVDDGEDELSRMASALRIFRNNAIEKRQLDSELLAYKTDLERLVAQRTEELRLSNETLAKEVLQHEKAREQAEQANHAKTAFLATMSHELRTPLSGALGTLQLLLDSTLDPKQMELVQTIDAANASLLDVLNDILGYSQLDAGKLKLNNRCFALEKMIEHVVIVLRPTINARGNQLKLVYRGEPELYLLGDSGKLHQVLLNLLGNANKFSDKACIELIVEANVRDSAQGVDLRFAVIDQGIGIDPARHQEIFEAFTQIDSSNAREHGGVGLGLAICDRLVTAMGGKMFIQSAINQGSTIGFNLRLTPQSEPVSGIAPQGESTPTLAVLVVEDDAVNRQIVAHYLSKLGHRYVLAETGEQALQMLDDFDADVVLLDISLPRMDGFAVRQAIHEHPRAAARLPKLIAMSAHVFAEEVDLFFAAGMDGFLGKPFSIKQLAESLRHPRSVTRPCPPQQLALNTRLISEDITALGLDSVRAIYQLFCEDIQQQQREMSTAIESQQWPTVAAAAHRLRGAVSNFGMAAVAHQLIEIESAAESADPTSLWHAFQRMQTQLAQSQDAVALWLADYSDSALSK